MFIESDTTFQQYASRWMKEYAEIENKPSTVVKHEQVLRLYLLPQFGSRSLKGLRRDEIKSYFSELAASGNLSRNSLPLILSTFRVILNHAVEDELLDRNPAEKLGRFTKADGEEKTKASAMTREEAELFLDAVRELSLELYPLFLIALRAGLRR